MHLILQQYFVISDSPLFIMVQVSLLLAAVSCAVSFVSGSPVDTPTTIEYTRIVPGSALDKTLEGKTLYPMQWRGQLEAGKPEVHLKGDTFEVCPGSCLSLHNTPLTLLPLDARTLRSRQRLSIPSTPSLLRATRLPRPRIAPHARRL